MSFVITGAKVVIIFGITLIQGVKSAKSGRESGKVGHGAFPVSSAGICVKMCTFAVDMKHLDFSVVPPIGWVVFLVGAIIAAIQMANADNFILGFLYFFGILFLTGIVTVIVSLIFLISADKETSTSMPSSVI